MKLRPYQAACIQAVKADWNAGIPNTLAVLATGAGKTNIFLWLLCGPEGVLRSNKRGLILAHRQDLIDQPKERLLGILPEWEKRVGIIMAEQNECDRQLTIASVQTLMQPHRLKWLLYYGKIDYVVVDECHRATADGYVRILDVLREANPDLKHLGVTATPIKEKDGLRSVYQNCCYKATIKELVPRYLVPPRWLAIATGISLEGIGVTQGDFVQKQLRNVYETANAYQLIVESWKKYAQGRKTMAFTVSVAGAYELADAFRAAGISAMAADGNTPKSERSEILHDFRVGKYQVLCNAMLWTEGLDVPEIDCILMCRPTRSDTVYVQAMGRGLRPVPGKDDCLILDFAPEEQRNIIMAGDVLGMPKKAFIQKPRAQRGEVIGGLTFDGKVKTLDGDPMELIARHLDYLDNSAFSWDRRHDWLILGLGPDEASNILDRTLAITPPVADQPQTCLLIERRPGRGAEVRVLAQGEFDVVSQAAHDYAEEHGNTTIVKKKRKWHREPISEGQLNWLLKLAKQSEIAQEIGTLDALTKGMAAKLITFFMARIALQRAGWWSATA